jgi:hypothetical protein
MDEASAATTTIYAIAEAMDAADYPALNRLLTHARLVDGQSGTVLTEGGDAAVAHFQSIVKIHDDGTWRTRHVTTNPQVTVDGDQVQVRSYYTVFQQTERLALQPIIVGRYQDTLQKFDGEWMLTERRYFADLIGDLSDHLTFTLSASGDSSEP